MSNKERLIANNEKIAEIRKALARKQVSPTDMLQARVDSNNSCAYLFYYYEGTSLDFAKGLDTSNATSMYNMFSYCNELTSLDLSFLNTSNITTFERMFYYSCRALTTLDLSNWDTSNVKRTTDMFNYCIRLKTINISGWDMYNVTNTQNMFYSCSDLTSIVGSLNLINSASNSSMFGKCSKLETVTLINIQKSISLSSSSNITNETLINTIKELWDLTGSTSQTLTLSTTSKENIANIYVKLVDVTDEMIAADQYAGNKKPCVVCEPTDEGAMTLTEYATSKNWAIA